MDININDVNDIVHCINLEDYAGQQNMDFDVNDDAKYGWVSQMYISKKLEKGIKVV